MSSAPLPSPRWCMAFLLLGGRQGPEDVAPSSSKGAAKVRKISDMATENFTLPKWQTEFQRHNLHGLLLCHEKGPSILTIIGGQSRLNGPFFSHGHAQCGTYTKKPGRNSRAFRFGVNFVLCYGKGFVSFTQYTILLSLDTIAPRYVLLWNALGLSRLHNRFSSSCMLTSNNRYVDWSSLNRNGSSLSDAKIPSASAGISVKPLPFNE